MATVPFIVRTSGFIDGSARKAAGLAAHSSPGTRHSDVMLTVFLDGVGTYANDHGSITVRNGMIGMVEPEDAGILYSSVDRPYSHYYCRFSGDYARHLDRRTVALRGGRFVEDPDYLSYAERIRRMGFLHSRAQRAGSPQEMGRREVLLAEILVDICSRLHAPRPAPAVDDPTALLNYLHDRPGEPVSVSDAAAHFGVSRNTLMRRVKAHFGVSLVHLHEQIRIEWATSLLDSHQFSVSEVADRVGYRSPDYFARVFRRQKGCSPSEWRRRNQ
jgi:AraC-like DNA-binding protein